MDVIIYREDYDTETSIEHFLNALFQQQLTYFASDLLEHGLSPASITNAVRKAMLAARAAKLNLRQHFQLLYTATHENLIRDCKLSRLGYALVLLNADVKNPMTASWQIKVLKHFLSS